MNRYFLLGILAIALTGCTQESSTNENLIAPIKAIQYLVVESQDIQPQRQLSGYLRPTKSAELSFNVAGQLNELNVKIGEKVVLGQAIASIDETPFKYKVAQAKAELASANAGFKERSENYQRQQLIFNQQLINKNAIDKAQADFEKAQSLVDLAQAKLSLTQRDLHHTTLRAPFDGMITRREIEQFEEVSSRQVIIEIQDKSHLEVTFLVPSTLITDIKLADDVLLNIPTVNYANQRARITKIGLESNMRGAYPVSAELENVHPNIHPGMAADVFIKTKQSSRGIILPESAVMIAANGAEQVFVYNKESKQVVSRTITSRLLNANQLLITSGLQAKEVVCTTGAEFLSDGQQVTLYKAAH
ncbi:efflux RND transporter periplasmic adaptor subunit [Pseudoalteromonas sp. 20-MNA-CIBAN-0454]|uniref:efflux RND transporter periplasmic adaptor subunit n=1 Tax=Pseudoalteromonas sp. 20-MNA-CIBAN-0454 TaxID=3140424 RepID=UPI00331DD375